MRIFKFGMMAAVAAVSLASCSSEADGNAPEINNREDAARELKLSTLITRAYDQTWEKDDKIGVYSFDNSSSAAIEYTNTPYFTEEGGASVDFKAWSDKIMLPVPVEVGGVQMAQIRRIAAYYPYTTTVEGATVKFSVANQTKQNAIDFMTSDIQSVQAFPTTRAEGDGETGDNGENAGDQENQGGQTGETPAAGDDAKVEKQYDQKAILAFNHRLSKMVINVKMDKSLTEKLGLAEDADLPEGTVVRAVDVYTEGQVKMTEANSKIERMGQVSNVDLIRAKDATGNYVAGQYEGILLPGSTDGMRVRFTVPGFTEPIVWTLQNTLTELAEGNRYTYTINLRADGVALVLSATINKWDDQTGTGEAF